MKKLVAILLALALVASFGVTSAFAALSISNADSAKLFGYEIDTDKDKQDMWGDRKALADEVATIYQDWELDYLALKNAGKSDDSAEIKTLNATNSAKLAALAATADGWAIVGWGLFDYATPADAFDGWQNAKQASSAAGANKKAFTTEEAYDTYWKNFYTKQAAIDDANGKDSAAKTKALNAYLASDRTEMDKAIYDVAVASVDAKRALADAKAAVADAKAEFAKAQTTWKNTVDVKVAQAQAEYYVAVADAYNDAVSEAVAAIYDALG